MSDPLRQPPEQYQQPYTYTGPYQPPKKKGLGCMGWGCIIMFVAVAIMVVLFGGAAYFAVTSVENMATGKVEETPTYEGTPDEKTALQKKLANLQDSFNKGELNTESFSANEINMMVDLSPPELNLKHHVFVKISDNMIDAQAAIPLGAILSLLGNATIDGEIVFVPSIRDGKVSMDIKSIKSNGHQLDDTTTKTFGQSFNDRFNDQLMANPDSAKILEHIKSITVENNMVTITTK